MTMTEQGPFAPADALAHAALLATGATGNVFPAGAASGLTDLAAAPPAVQVASSILNAARQANPRPVIEQWRDSLGDTEFARVLEEASERVLSLAEVQWKARADVLDTWAGRLYAPPVATQPATLSIVRAMLADDPLPASTVQTWSVRSLLNIAQAVMAEAAADGEKLATFKASCAASVMDVLQADGDRRAEWAAAEAVRVAADAALFDEFATLYDDHDDEAEK